jgi:hypothetical protein
MIKRSEIESSGIEGSSENTQKQISDSTLNKTEHQ